MVALGFRLRSSATVCIALVYTEYMSFCCTPWRSWLRHCATSRKVAGSIPDGVTGIFEWLNTSGRSVALGSTQPLNRKRPVRRADNLTTFMCRLSRNSEAWTSWNPKGLSRPTAGKLYLLHVFYCYLLILRSGGFQFVLHLLYYICAAFFVYCVCTVFITTTHLVYTRNV
jgi:hypothetical protein